jgi:hypothetical protein
MTAECLLGTMDATDDLFNDPFLDSLPRLLFGRPVPLATPMSAKPLGAAAETGEWMSPAPHTLGVLDLEAAYGGRRSVSFISGRPLSMASAPGQPAACIESVLCGIRQTW